MAKTPQQDTGVSEIFRNQVMLQHGMSTFHEAGLFNEAQCFLTAVCVTQEIPTHLKLS